MEIRIPFLNKSTNHITARWVVLLIDISLVLQTFFVAYLVRFNFVLDFGTHHFILQLPLVAVLALVSFYIIGSYKGVVRHTGTRDAYNVFLAAVLLALFLGLIVFLNRKLGILQEFTIPRSIIVIHFLLNVIVLIASRYVFKQVYYMLLKGVRSSRKVLIYGAGDSGLITYNTIKNDQKSEMQVVGFIDDNLHKKGKTYDGIKVFHRKQIDTTYIEKRQIKDVIVSIQNISASELLDLVEKITELPVKVKIVPPVEKWIDGELKASQIKEIKIDDLLDRNPIQVNNPEVQKEIQQKTVLITGAAGSIGSELAKQISSYEYEYLILLDQAESAIYDIQQDFIQRKIQNFTCLVADIRDKKRMQNLFDTYNIQIIYHAAAYKHVPLMEDSPYEAVQVNVLGSKKLMDLAIEHHVEKFVMVSTDKAVNPTNVMGATKRVAEMYASYCAKQKSTQFIATRFGNVLGSNGSVIPLFKKQIAKGGPLTVTHAEITRYFMTIPEACQLVLEAGAMGKGGEVFVFDMGKSVKIFDLAKKMIQLSGFKYPDEISIEIVGLRQGEKLYEELLSDEENTKATYHPKIMIAKVAASNETVLLESIDKLKFLSDLSDSDIVRYLKKIVPEYKSNNSEYSSLD
jgi:FlaA1/EpsC-like NDP-sugar epimerase